jgi:hypothetical protein
MQLSTIRRRNRGSRVQLSPILTTAIIQSPGICAVLPIKRLQEVAERSGTFRKVLARHEIEA